MYGNVDQNLLTKMLKSIVHRGPDDEGSYVDDNVAFGSRRLSIIDIESGHQPIHNEDKTIWVIQNGEIYNYMELRKKLQRKHKFYTKSDTEVLVHLYEEFQEKCVEKLNGMFAFIIWDLKKQQMFIARDRLGIKPFYYYLERYQKMDKKDSSIKIKRFVFASEIKAILQDPTIPREPNDKAIYEYLNWAFFDHTEETFFLGIKRVMPAHYMIIRSNEIKIKRYWDIKINPSIDKPPRKHSALRTDEDYAKRFYELLEEAVKYRLISEVPVGTRLSGGLDSSAIVCIINKLLFSNLDMKANREMIKEVIGDRQKIFSALYKEKEVNESEYITEVVNKAQVEKNYTYPTHRTLWSDIHNFIYYEEEPFINTSCFADWSTSKLASKKVTVLLDGQGADELIAGYYPYYGIYFLNLLDNKKYFQLFKELAFSIDIIHPYLRDFLNQMVTNPLEHEIRKMLDTSFIKKHSNVKRLQIGRILSKSLYFDIVKYSIPRILRMVDKNSMAFSVEIRVPFLDHRLVEYAFSLPSNQKIRNGWTKFILRNSTKGVLPEKIRLRRNKIGFATPQADWLRKLEPEIKKIFTSKKFKNRGYFNQVEILKKFKDFCKGDLDEYSDLFWRIINLELWLEMYVDDWEKWANKFMNKYNEINRQNLMVI